MEVLKQTRGHLKGAITRGYNFALNIPGDTAVEVLEVRLERLEDAWKDFRLNQNEFYQFHAVDGYTDPETDFEAVENKYIAAKGALLSAIRGKSTQDLAHQEASSLEELGKSTYFPSAKMSNEVELPPIKIPPFSGDYREWPGFRDMFQGSIDCKKNLSGAQKLRYLKSFLRDDAAKLLNHIDISDANYEQAWKKLERRYDRPLHIINSYIESFLKLPVVTFVDSSHLRKLVDGADEVVRGLKAIKSESRDPWLIYLLIQKIDTESRKAWALHNKNSEDSTVYQLLEFLEIRCSALETSEPKGRSKILPPSSTNSKVKSFAVCKSECPKCKGNHLLFQCSQFLALPIIDRRSFVKDQRLCYNCLGPHHSSSRCRVAARCSRCQSRHHTSVHLDNSVRPSQKIRTASSPINSTPSENSSDPVISNHIVPARPSSGILPTMLVKIRDVFGHFHCCRVLLDTGSQVSFVTNRLVKRLGLQRRHARLPISGISALEAGITQGAVSLELHSRFDSSAIVEIDAYILTTITSFTPSSPIDFDNFLAKKDCALADPKFNIPGAIDVLLGSDKAWSILRDGHHSNLEGNLFAQNTIFGWVVAGSIPRENMISLHVGVDIDVLLKSFWEIEEGPGHSGESQDEDAVDQHFVSTFSRAADKRYVVKLPFQQKECQFRNTLSWALSRLAALERRFSRCANLRSDYCEFMKLYQQLGHMERIPSNEVEPTTGKVFYLPHHAVITNKMRVVFDGSHKDSHGVSLNERLHVGPPLQRNLLHIYFQFRLYKYVFCADIVKMFRQIWINPGDRDFQRIVWRDSPEKPIEHFRLCTVTYGTSSAPFLAIRTLRQLAKDYGHRYPKASYAVLNNSYVDDFAAGSDAISDLLELKEQLVGLLACGGLELGKWISNCWEVMCSVDSEPDISLNFKGLNNWKKVLGLVWNPYHDHFTFKLSLKNQHEGTKRSLLSEISKIFDPMGFLSPSTILLKIIFQELWMANDGAGWDDPLSEEVAEKWNAYRQQIHAFEKVMIPRRYTANSSCFDLIGFSDASEKAYSAVVYARSVTDEGSVEINLVVAKARVAPIKQISIPRLELCGALLLSRLVKLICSSLDTRPNRIIAFTDSEIVLAWLSSLPRRWNTFVANRTAEILDILPRSAWHHVCSKDNPADCASRGVSPEKLVQLEIWWRGPKWMSADLEHWNLRSESASIKVPEERSRATKVLTSQPTDHFLDDLSNKISAWPRLIRIVGYVCRFIQNCRNASTGSARNCILLSEYQKSKEICLRLAQKEFQNEYLDLNISKQVSKRSKLCTLSPFIDEVGLLRVGGRILNANVPFHIKHPIILPKHHRITHLILQDAHIRFLHPGVSEMFSLVRQEYWIMGSRNLIRKIVHSCIKCFRLRQGTSSQLMGDLPSSRLSPSLPFTHTGCDYAGPITLRLSKGRKPKLTKGYIALFVCMVTKALHLEVVSDLSTEACLAAMKRFTARRGRCSVMYSDNGTNFRGAARVLNEMYTLLRSKEHNELIASSLAAENTKWEFIPPHSPHFGGIWEAGIKCVKQHLRRIVGNNILTFEEMYTLLTQIESLLNSRPLCLMSDSDLNPLTPSHFLIGRPYTAIPEPSYLDVPTNRLGRWELVQNMLQGFWKSWHQDYLTSLQQRPKWQQRERNIEIADIVVVKEKDAPPSKWSLGRVEELHPGKDGLVRVASIRTNGGLFKRPITKLTVLPISEVPSGAAAC